MQAPRLTLVTRDGCHLCEEMAAVAEEVARRVGATVDTADVDADEVLRERYGNEVPVLLVGGRKAFKYRVTARELERRIEAERRRRFSVWRRLVPGLRRSGHENGGEP